MRIYDMRCVHPLCCRVFDWHTRAGVYNLSKADGFRDVSCYFCGRRGAKRALTSAPADLTVKGTWGEHASPELRGKDYYTKQEYERQVATTGRAMVDSGNDRGALAKSDKPAPTQRDKAREAITSLLEEHGEMKLKDIVSETGLTNSAVNDVIYKDPGRIQKVGWGTYGLTGDVSQTEASA